MAYTQNLRTDASSLVYQMKVDVYAPISHSILYPVDLRGFAWHSSLCQRLQETAVVSF